MTTHIGGPPQFWVHECEVTTHVSSQKYANFEHEHAILTNLSLCRNGQNIIVLKIRIFLVGDQGLSLFVTCASLMNILY